MHYLFIQHRGILTIITKTTYFSPNKLKYKNTIIYADGIRFQSKKEMNHYQNLKLLQKAGKLSFFLRQAPFHLPGNIKYICDFICFWTDGTITFEDVKGFKTNIYKIKKKLVQSTYPIQITEI